MQTFLMNLLVALITKLASWAYNKGLKKLEEHEQSEALKEKLDQKKEKVKEAYSEAFNGEPVSKEQREKINSALRDLIHSDSTLGL